MKTICKVSLGFSVLIILLGCDEKPAVGSIQKTTITAAELELVSNDKPLVFQECVEPALYSDSTQSSTKPVCEIFKGEFTTEAISNISVIHSIHKDNTKCCITFNQDGRKKQHCQPQTGNHCPEGWTERN